MKIVIVSVSYPVLSDLIKVFDEVKNITSEKVELFLYYAKDTIEKEKLIKMNSRIETADFTILDLMGAPRELNGYLEPACKNTKGNLVTIGGESKEIRKYFRIGSYTAKDMGMGKDKSKKDSSKKKEMDMAKMMDMAEKMGKIVPIGKPRDMKNYVHIGKYWRNSDIGNIKNLMYLILRDYGKIKDVPKPEEPRYIEDVTICYPVNKKFYKNYEDYKDDHFFDKEKTTIAVLFYGHNYPNKTSDVIGKFVQKLEQSTNVLPIAFDNVSSTNLDKLKELLFTATGQKVDLIVNFMSFRLGAGPMGGNAQGAIDILNDLNVPILHPYLMSRRKISEWEESAEGSSSSEFLVSVMLPELDGCIEMLPIGGLGGENYNQLFDIEINEVQLIEERCERLINKIINWTKLQKKPKEDLKIAINCYNYPPGEDNLFGGAFLDTFESIENILKVLQENGYSVDSLNTEQLMDKFRAGNIVNSGRFTSDIDKTDMIKYSSNKYKEEFSSKYYKEDMISQWDNPPGTVMTDDDDFIIPGIISNNVFLGLQPSRGVHENPEKVYHDKSLLPHHQYIAYYKWLKEEFKADVIIHVGTHGTLEFLTGKECGMSGDCFPDMLMSDIPHLYLYYCGNPAEAMIAKRRSHAVTIGYQPPVYMEGELYGEYSKLESMIADYNEALRVDPKRSNDVMNNVIEKAKELNLCAESLDDIENELYRMNRSLMPKGLHVYGKGYSNDEAQSYMKFVLRYDRSNTKSLRRIFSEIKNIDYDYLLDNNCSKELAELDNEVADFLVKYNNCNTFEFLKIESAKVIEDLQKTLDYGKKVFESSLNCHESEGLLKGLSGQYLPAKLAGDIVRNPDILPSGYNLYQFDPRLVPSQAAYTRGIKIADNTINQYREQNGTYPSSVAVILWGLETSRTQGETVGQILHYLGIRVKNKMGQFEPTFEIIPTEELGRPRIDVVINICGFFRDMFPNLIEEFNRLFSQLVVLDEKDELNFFKANCNKIYSSLLKEGYSDEEATELSTSRIFGPAEGEYGTRITKLIETKNWEDESQIGATYIDSLKHVYSKNYRGKAVDGLINKNLAVVDIVSQIRSNHEYEVTDLDHYYEYFGGLAKSVEMVKGKKSEVFITDTTGEKVETESVEKSIARGVKTRLLNPKWIDGMLEHKYHGVQKIEERFENILGLAATTNRVENWVFKNMHSTYVSDEEMRKRMMENNKWAYQSILERLMEYNKRGYWDATEKELEELRNVYLDIEGEIEENL